MEGQPGSSYVLIVTEILGSYRTLAWSEIVFMYLARELSGLNSDCRLPMGCLLILRTSRKKLQHCVILL